MSKAETMVENKGPMSYLRSLNVGVAEEESVGDVDAYLRVAPFLKMYRCSP